jgi:hypothetical protein
MEATAMAFFDSLRRVLGSRPASTEDLTPELAKAWGVYDSAATDPTSHAGADEAVADATSTASQASAYDIEQWRKKLKRILDKLPGSEAEWEPMLAEARALGLDDEWVLKIQLDEFTMLIRRAVADRRITEEEHRKIDLARTLIGMSEDEAEELLQVVAAEAADFFGKPVDGA